MLNNFPWRKEKYSLKNRFFFSTISNKKTENKQQQLHWMLPSITEMKSIPMLLSAWLNMIMFPSMGHVFLLQQTSFLQITDKYYSCSSKFPSLQLHYSKCNANNLLSLLYTIHSIINIDKFQGSNGNLCGGFSDQPWRSDIPRGKYMPSNRWELTL